MPQRMDRSAKQQAKTRTELHRDVDSSLVPSQLTALFINEGRVKKRAERSRDYNIRSLSALKKR